jgi:hypothetical protein
VFFPFRRTYAIEYFQHVRGLTLNQAGVANSWLQSCSWSRAAWVRRSANYAIQALGMAASNLAAGWLADKAGAGAQNPSGYVLKLTAKRDRKAMASKTRGTLHHSCVTTGIRRFLAGKAQSVM